MSKRPIAAVLVGAVLAAGSTAFAQSAQDLACKNAAQDYLQTCQKRIAPVDPPVDPNRPTASEQKAMDKRAKAWQACKDKALKRGNACTR